MRVLGYPREKISILTTYNGQASLLRDIIRKKCADNPLIGEPRIISTVDKYQGQQNDYIILSLVRTNLVGHIRDIRRLIVALSRARLGLYIFGRVSLFRNCFELTPAFNRLCERPTRLQLVPNETYDSPRKLGDKPQIAPVEIVDTMHMSQFVNQFYTANLELLQARFAEEVKRLRPPALDKPEEPAKEPEEEKPEEASAEPAEGAQDPKKKKEDAEGAIVFEEVDFERLQEMPNYG
ncbi:AQR protein [Aphelenchoides avenae]|nr:AQR protein [Aphelenchus avenae]